MRCVCVLIALSLGCRREGLDVRPAPESKPRHVEAPPKTPRPSTTVSTLVGYAGQVVTIEGRLSRTAHPRIVEAPAGKRPKSVELGSSLLRVTAYVAEEPACSERVRMTGRVFVARGMVKDGTTLGEYAEPQLDVADWECL